MMWQRADDKDPISQVTPPEEVLAFIDSHPGLADACIEHPSYMLSCAPQLALPGVAGWLQEIVDETWQWARDRVASSGVDPDGAEGRRRLLHGPSYLVLRDIEVVKVDRLLAACAWAHGELNGPPVRVYELIDYAGWLVRSPVQVDTARWRERAVSSRRELLVLATPSIRSKPIATTNPTGNASAAGLAIGSSASAGMSQIAARAARPSPAVMMLRRRAHPAGTFLFSTSACAGGS